MRDRDEGVAFRAFNPRRDLAAIECRYGTLARPLSVLQHIEGAVDRFGKATVFNSELEGFRIVTGANKERHQHLL